MAAMPKPPRRSGDGGRHAARLSVKKTDGKRRGRQAEIDPLASVQQFNAALPGRSNFLCLEHELQTVVDGGSDAAAITLGATVSAAASAAHLAVGARRTVSSGCPAPLRTSASLFRRPAPVSAPELSESGVRLLPVGRGAIAAGVPDALTGHNRNL
jgi:hypothetical protein